ncbi:Transposase [Arsukibacterium tuosuense]|uniref:Transposase n=1 Tax=Arsukibacterium tuosuense TaxID=1323745 RepID=A0A285JLI0_9GAMM|nr:IS110 family transposase [Arsukibacterium tuosuense]SNY61135.1 Transposase [Arsukibacterium tuosuense]
MKLYVGIDLHSNNSVLVIIDENDRVIYSKRLPNDAQVILGVLAMYKEQIEAVAVESTYNWYWLVDALQEVGYEVRLVNTASVVIYDGLKYSGDVADARHLAHLLRMNLLPCGYIYPKEPRALRDLARKRAQLVRQKTTQLLSIKNLLVRNTGRDTPSYTIKTWTPEHVAALPLLPEQLLALQANWAVLQALELQIQTVEAELLRQLKPCKTFQLLKTVSGIGDILSMTIYLETGDISRFNSSGNFASYARMVNSKRESNGKKKGEGNRKCGNRYLCWAFMEAAHFAIGSDELIKRFYQRKCAKSLKVVAMKAVAHKLARACYNMLKDGVEFDVKRAFS